VATTGFNKLRVLNTLNSATPAASTTVQCHYASFVNRIVSFWKVIFFQRRFMDSWTAKGGFATKSGSDDESDFSDYFQAD
jgi:hypothetical protein